MVQAFANAQRYDWQTWGIGIMRSFLSGGATAFATLGGGAAVGVGGGKLWAMIGINFALMGLYRMGEFLTLHGAPDTVVTEEKTLDVQPSEGGGVKVAQTIKTTTSTEPPAGGGTSPQP